MSVKITDLKGFLNDFIMKNPLGMSQHDHDEILAHLSQELAYCLDVKNHVEKYDEREWSIVCFPRNNDDRTTAFIKDNGDEVGGKVIPFIRRSAT